MSACDRYSPKDSLSGAVNYICNYLKEHPGWSREDIVKLIEELQKEEFVNSFNGRSGEVNLVSSDVNNLEIASAYFALTENVDDLNITELYENGVRLIFAGYDIDAQHYTELYGLHKLDGVVDKEVINTGGQEISYPVTSVNGKTGAVRLKLGDVLIDSAASAQVWMGTKVEFDPTAVNAWNALYREGYRLAVVVDDQHENVTGLYVLNQGTGQVNNTPIPVQLGGGGEPVDPNLVEQVQKNTEAIGAINDEMPRKYSPTNEPPYPVTTVNGDTGDVKVDSLYMKSTNDRFNVDITDSFGELTLRTAKGAVSAFRLNYAGREIPLVEVFSQNWGKSEVLNKIHVSKIGDTIITSYDDYKGIKLTRLDFLTLPFTFVQPNDNIDVSFIVGDIKNIVSAMIIFNHNTDGVSISTWGTIVGKTLSFVSQQIGTYGTVNSDGYAMGYVLLEQ